ncbi:hypothetical protein O181_098043 [Austropuccinia psidii MF-1]|uniref:Mid2 domain-containing protein n=1 Tax=Austropuccinia psidii MF-1 TaxID=1389203 RepID=A0A9Q3JA21_9BASI|nr:hypothetical protein [Austropuccinia psidii MF-1]
MKIEIKFFWILILNLNFTTLKISNQSINSLNPLSSTSSTSSTSQNNQNQNQNTTPNNQNQNSNDSPIPSSPSVSTSPQPAPTSPPSSAQPDQISSSLSSSPLISSSNPTQNSQSQPLTTSSHSISSNSLSLVSSQSVQSSSISSPSQSPHPASSIIIVTVTKTNADGSVYTSLTSSFTSIPSVSPSTNSSSSSSSSSSSTTLAIIGGIIGGLALLAALVFIVFRCTQRRFSDLDDDNVAIKWPELVNRSDDPSTLNPLAARPALGHGIGDEDLIENEKSRNFPPDFQLEDLNSDHAYHSNLYEPYNPYHSQNLLSSDSNAYSPQPYPHQINHQPFQESGYHDHRTIDLRSQPSHYSSNNFSSDSSQPITQSNIHSELQNQNEPYQLPWDGNEAIPLTVVNHHHSSQSLQRSSTQPPQL